jgi:hypothetical protein
VPSKAVMVVRKGKLKCSWNSKLFANGRYIFQSITGQRIGIQNIAYKMLL